MKNHKTSSKGFSFFLAVGIMFATIVVLIVMGFAGETENRFFLPLVSFALISSAICAIEFLRGSRFTVKNKGKLTLGLLLDFAIVAAVCCYAYSVIGDVDTFISYFLIIQVANLPILGYIIGRNIALVHG